MTALSEILGINEFIKASKVAIPTGENKFTTLDKFLKKNKTLVYDLTLQADSNHVTIPCDILRDGGNYELLCVGKLVSGSYDIYLRINNNNNNIYYQCGFGYNFTGGTNDSTGNLWQGYRPNKDGCYICSGWFNGTNSRCSLKYNISMSQANDYTVITMENGRTYNSSSFIGLGNCQTSEPFANITSIDLLPGNGNGSFAAGTRFILRKL